MKTISLSQAIEELSRATAIQVDDSSLVYPELYEEGDENHDNGLFLGFETCYGVEKFATKDHAEIRLDDQGRMVLMNTRGDETTILLLIPSPIEHDDDDISEGVQITCDKCGCDLDENGYCTDPTCPYHDWPQSVALEDMYEMTTAQIEVKYGVKKRAQ